MRRSEGRSSGITRRCAKPAARVTIPTVPTTIGCSSPSCRCSVKAATSARSIPRRSTTGTRSRRRAIASSAAVASTVIRRSTGPTAPRATRCCAEEDTIMPMMRSAVLTLLSLLVAAGASGQQNTPPPEPDQNTGISSLAGGQVDFGFRGTFFSDGSDEARYQRYQDLRSGPFAEAFRWGKSDYQQYWDVRATHVGYRDQQYAANYNKFGKMKASFEYNQIPLFFSQDARTAYTDAGNGVRSLDGYPAQVQSAAATSAIYNNVATAFDMRLKRSITDFRFVYSLTNQLDVSGSFKNTQKTGEQPWAGTFGFGNAVELTTPVDTRTTDVGVAAEWTAPRGYLRV